ncbi:MAG: hypothetical protein KAI85_16950 [Halopseudomonas aestusnigri]|nr:hypothetical protein [Halopseudomonas aestusnigri]
MASKVIDGQSLGESLDLPRLADRPHSEVIRSEPAQGLFSVMEPSKAGVPERRANRHSGDLEAFSRVQRFHESDEGACRGLEDLTAPKVQVVEQERVHSALR